MERAPSLCSKHDGWIMNSMDDFTELTTLRVPSIKSDLIDIALTDRGCKSVARVLVIYTGGTIGMRKCPISGTYKPQSNYMLKALHKLPILHDTEFSNLLNQDDGMTTFSLPLTKENRRILYSLAEYSPLLDSSNCTFDSWVQIARDISGLYNKYEGFVVLHGTDTLAYASSALSFIFENLSKPVIITGSQIPLFETRSDGRDNFIGALLLAGGDYHIPEVSVFFHNKLFRGNRCVKSSSVHFDAFDSPNYPPIAEMSIDINVHQNRIQYFPSEEYLNDDRLFVMTRLETEVVLLRIFPSISTNHIKHVIGPNVKGVVIQSYGAGNVPSSRQDLMKIFGAATERGVILVNITQCFKGGVQSIYETGAELLKYGVIPGFDMTPEAALTKLSYVLAKTDNFVERRRLMCCNLRGEITFPLNMEGLSDLIDLRPKKSAIAWQKQVSVDRDLDSVLFEAYRENTSMMLPMLLWNAAKNDDLPALEVLEDKLGHFEWRDHNNRTILHLAALYGSERMIQYLMHKGVNVRAQDSHGFTPLLLAIHECDTATPKLISLFMEKQSDQAGSIPSLPIKCVITSAAARGDIRKLRLLQCAGYKLSMLNDEGRNALHIAIAHGHLDAVQYLVAPCPGRSDYWNTITASLDAFAMGDPGAGLSPLSPTSYGTTALSEAIQRGNNAVIEVLNNANTADN